MNKRAIVAITAAVLVVSTTAVANAVNSNVHKGSILMSTSADHSTPIPVNGNRVSGEVALFVAASPGTKAVTYYLDDPSLTKPLRVERLAPYDFNGTTSDRNAVMFNVSNLSVGQHEVAAVRLTKAGTKQVERATFTVVASSTGVDTTSDSVPTPRFG